MMSLLNKLRMLDAQAARPAPATPAPAKALYHGSSSVPLSTFCDRRHATPEVLASAFGLPQVPRLGPEDVLFLDTETTGLSGGVGTVAFLVGLGYFTPQGFTVEQFLMHDYPQEPELLSRVSAILRRYPALCTFNGRTFDVPLLEARLTMNRLPRQCFPPLHLDVLFPSRRLWKLRLKSCTLGNLEERLLHISREDDLPGAQVPALYFQYLKDGDFAPLERVLEHNRQDIVSLAQLFYFLCYQVNRPEAIAHGEDLLSLARAMEKRGYLPKAMKCYRLCAKGATRAPAYNALAQNAKRQGNVQAAVRLYQAMARRGDDPVEAYEALAKLYEHRLSDPGQALHYTRQALLLLSEPGLFRSEAVQNRQIALQYRYARLRRRLSSAPKR